MINRIRKLHYISILAAQILLLFIASLMRDHVLLIALFILGLFGVFGSVICTIWKHTLARFIAILCGATAIAGGVPLWLSDVPPWLDSAGLFVCCMSYTVFILVAIISMCQGVFVTDRVTSNRIVGSICIYLLIGMFFAFLFAAVAIVLPGAIHFDAYHGPVVGRVSDFLYFSYSTLTTTGYGDMVPTHPITKMLASIEGMTGSIYLAIMVARLVGMHVVSQTTHHHAHAAHHAEDDSALDRKKQQ